MAKRKRKPSVADALAGIGKDVSGGAKKTAKKVATPEVNKRAQTLQDRGAAVRTFGPLERQPTYTERASAKSEKLRQKRTRQKRKRLAPTQHKPDPIAKGIRRAIRAVDQAVENATPPEELPAYYKKLMRPKTYRALERHVSRMPAIESAEREELRKTKVKSTFEDIVEELPAVKLYKGITKTKKLILDPAAKELEKSLKKVPLGTGSGAGLPVAAGKARKAPKADLSILARAAKDIAGLPVDVPAGAAKTIGATAKAATGDTKELKEIVNEALEHDPYLLLAQGKGEKALQEFSRHPGLAALEAAGASAGVSRIAAVGARAATRGAVGDYKKRAPKVLPSTGVKHRQEYSRGLYGQTRQKRKERAQSEEAKGLYKESMQARRRGDRAGAAQKYREATAKNPFRLTETRDPRGPLQRRIDSAEHVAEQRRRVHREKALEEVEKVLPKKHRDIAMLIGANIVQPTRKSLRAYADHLKDVEKHLGPAKSTANRALRDKIETALADKKLDLEELGKAAREFGRVTGRFGKELVEREILDKGAEQMAKLIPVAVSPRSAGGMGAIPGEKSGPRVKADSFDVDASLKSIARNRHKDKTKRVDAPVALQRRVEEEQLRDLRPGEIKAHLRRTGRDPEEAAFFSQKPFTDPSSAFYMGHPTQPKGIGSKRRTGKGVEQGAFSLTDETPRESVARMAGLKSLHDEYAEILNEFGRREGKSLKSYRTRGAAEQKQTDLAAKGQDWEVVPLKPLFGRGKQADELFRRANELDLKDMDDSPAQGVAEALRGGEGAAGSQYVLLQKYAANRFSKHIEATKVSDAGRLWRETNRLFRGAVLATSPSWLLGNITEASLRAALKGAGRGSYKLGKTVLTRLERIDPKAAEELWIRLGQGHMGMQELQAIHVAVSQFDNSSQLVRGAVGFGSKVRRGKGIERVANGWKRYTHVVFDKNGLLERQFKVALLGRRLKQDLKGAHGLLPNARELRTMDRAIDDLAKGLKGTDAQVQMTEWVTRAYGRYEGFGPAGRKFIAQYTPFAAWYINAANFVFHVMPQDHPVLTGFLAANDRATEEWQHEMGLDIAPPWLRGALPVKGGFRPLSRYTPFGAFADPLETPVNLFLPSISPLIMNARGLDWTGKPIGDKKSPDDVTTNERLKEAGGTLLSAFVPIFGQVKRGFDKEGSIPERALEVLNPVRKTDFNVKQERAFNRREAIEAELDKLPTLEEAELGSKEWTARKKLNDEKSKIDNVIFKTSKGKYGEEDLSGLSSYERWKRGQSSVTDKYEKFKAEQGSVSQRYEDWKAGN